MSKIIRDHQLENYSNEDDYRPRKSKKFRKFKDEDKVNSKKVKKV